MNRIMGGIVLTIAGFVFFIISLWLLMNMELWVNHVGEDWRLLIPLFCSPVLIFVGIRNMIIEYRISKFMSQTNP